MKEKLMLGDFIYTLRKEAGLTQTQLGDMLGVSNKAVSKWETGEANPELNLIPQLAKALNVTTDELLACKADERAKSQNEEESGEESDYCLFGIIKGKKIKDENGIEFISDSKTVGGTPYVHINIGGKKDGRVRRAKGIVAIAPISQGILSLGLVSMGIVSVGLVSLGILATGLLALGLLAVGAVAIGGAAVGAAAVGVVAVGAVAIGYLSVGALSVGVYAYTGLQGMAIGVNVFYK